MSAMEPCEQCGEDTAAGTPRFVDRQRVDGRLLCPECARREKRDAADSEVAVTQPNTNFPLTH